MSQELQLKVIAHIRTDFPSKFGIPRQSGLVDGLESIIVFEPEYRSPEALRGIEGFSHLWLIWEFSECVREGWSPTVRPPKLGGNERVGVFATRSPFRPNPIGLSCVKLLGVETTAEGCVLRVSGADLMDGTPLFDIKPYLAYTDIRAQATGGFSRPFPEHELKVNFPQELARLFAPEKLAALTAVLAQDPRPGYHDAADRVYGFPFSGFDIRFTVEAGELIVTEVVPCEQK